MSDDTYTPEEATIDPLPYRGTNMYGIGESHYATKEAAFAAGHKYVSPIDPRPEYKQKMHPMTEQAAPYTAPTMDGIPEVHVLAEIIWRSSRADEGTISALGADILAQAILWSEWMQKHDAALEAGVQTEATDALRELAKHVNVQESAPVTIAAAIRAAALGGEPNE